MSKPEAPPSSSAGLNLRFLLLGLVGLLGLSAAVLGTIWYLMFWKGYDGPPPPPPEGEVDYSVLLIGNPLAGANHLGQALKIMLEEGAPDIEQAYSQTYFQVAYTLGDHLARARTRDSLTDYLPSSPASPSRTSCARDRGRSTCASRTSSMTSRVRRCPSSRRLQAPH